MVEVTSLSPGARALRVVDEAFFKFEKFLALIAALVILAIMLVGTFQVFGRKLLSIPVPGYVDVIEMVMTIFAFIAIAYCQRLGGHVRMEILLTHLKGRVLYFFEIMGTLAAIAIISFLTFYGYQHFMRAWTIGDSTIDVQLPIWPSKLLVPAAFAVLLVRLLIQLIAFTRLLIWPDALPIAVPQMESVDEQARHEIEVGLADRGAEGVGRDREVMV
jgi:TRAP-type mannitol/chloroaromatic compound transport system permease small subunit